jgi:hypothetical protein
VADTSKLFEKQEGSGDVVARNFPLSPRLPFNGGQLRLVAGLFGMEGANHLNDVIGMMSDFASLLTVPQLSATLEVARPLASGLQTLFGGKNGAMHLGFHDTFVGADHADEPPPVDPDGDTPAAGNVLREGYVAVIRAPAADVRTERFWVKSKLLQAGSGLDACTPYEEHDHMLLHFDVRADRDDWDQLDDIQGPYRKALEALRDFEDEKADAHVRAAIVAALQSPDLTRADRNRVVRLIKDDYVRAKQQVDVAGLDVAEGSALSAARVGAWMSVDEALAMGTPSYGELLADL